MTHETRNALLALTKGLDDLLDCLTAEQQLRIDYQKAQLRTACKVLRQALGDEETEP